MSTMKCEPRGPASDGYACEGPFSTENADPLVLGDSEERYEDAAASSTCGPSLDAGHQPVLGDNYSAVKQRYENGLEFNEGNWSVAELKKLFQEISWRGTGEVQMPIIANAMSTRSTDEVRAKIGELKKFAAENRMVRAARRAEKARLWARKRTAPDFSNVEMSSWSDAVDAIQKKKRRIGECTIDALSMFLWDEARRRPWSLSSCAFVPVTEAISSSSEGMPLFVEWESLYRMLYNVASPSEKRKPFKHVDSAILLHILEELWKEIDTPKYEEKRRFFAGMFRDIQDGNLDDFGLPVASGDEEFDPDEAALKLQLNPLNLDDERYLAKSDSHGE